MSDLCDEPDAELQCSSSLARAIEIDSENLDALQGLASLCYVREENTKAGEILRKVVGLIEQIAS